MTPIERLRDMVAASKISNVQWPGAEDLAALLAAYDARGEELDYRRAFGSGEPWKDRDVLAIESLRAATDSAVARVEGGE